MQAGQPDIGDVIAGKYVIERVLGRGGMGTVYGVIHQLTGKHLALKCLLPSFLDNPSVVERFLREARAAGRIQHRNVIDVFDTGREGDVLYIVMPLLVGKPLGELLKDPDVTLEEVLVVLIRAMEGVAAAHELGIVHRDLKPGNIFVCVGASGQLDDPKVLDFGISKLEDELSSPLTRSGQAIGTPYYMPLEQLTGQRDLDRRVDVYALGVILYEAIAGKPPHNADNVAMLAIQRMHTPPLPLSLLRSDLPAGLDAVIMRALARDRVDRFPSVRALIDALAPFVGQSAGLRVPERRGPTLRTPTDEVTPPLPAEAAHPSAPTAPSEPPVGRITSRARVQVSAPAPRGPQSSLAPRRVGRPGRLALAGLVALTAVGIAVERMVARVAPSASAPAAAPPAHGPAASPPAQPAASDLGQGGDGTPIALPHAAPPAPARRTDADASSTPRLRKHLQHGHERQVALASTLDATIAPSPDAASDAHVAEAPRPLPPVADAALPKAPPDAAADERRGDSLSVEEF